ncbi:hypothetical protein J2Z30_000743 [Streptomyces iranensis]|uniref:Uncharacterized protein n=1 Tax=Streptomyces iranensis TaxID=576784 RepID=A0ABS4MJ75_9ACTN|nr:hypothetical protein [Streptomyces iranensis]
MRTLSRIADKASSCVAPCRTVMHPVCPNNKVIVVWTGRRADRGRGGPRGPSAALPPVMPPPRAVGPATARGGGAGRATPRGLSRAGCSPCVRPSRASGRSRSRR